MCVFMLGGTTYGMAEESLALYALIIAAMLALRYDALTGVAVILLGRGPGREPHAHHQIDSRRHHGLTRRSVCESSSPSAGNALLRRGESMTLEAQRHNVRIAAAALAPLARHHQLVLSHGNGPQIGLLALQATAYTPSSRTRSTSLAPRRRA